MLEQFGSWIESYGYFAVFFYSLGGGMVGLIAGGVAASFGKLDIAALILIAGVGNFGNSLVLYYFTKANRGEIKLYLNRHRRKLAYAHLMFKKYGNWVIFVQKFIHVVRTLGIMAIALTRFPTKKFIVLSFFASFVWAASVGLTTYLATDAFVSLFENIEKYWYVLPAIIMALIYFLSRGSGKRKKVPLSRAGETTSA